MREPTRTVGFCKLKIPHKKSEANRGGGTGGGGTGQGEGEGGGRAGKGRGGANFRTFKKN